MMQSIFEDKKRRVIKSREEISFFSYSSFHLIKITARANSEKQLEPPSTRDEDLTIEIDGKTFPKLGIASSLIESPAAFCGGELHGLSKTAHFLIFLRGRDHRLVLSPKDPPGSATLEGVEIHTLSLGRSVDLIVQNKAEDGNGRPWLTFTFENLQLNSFTPTITFSRRERDSDDVKIISDGRTLINPLRTIKYKFWRYAGGLLPEKFSSRTDKETFNVNLPKGRHYLEFHADREPVLHFLTIKFSGVPEFPYRVPTEENPKWTNDFYDDPEDILLARLILGEAEGQSKEAKIGVGFTVMNRLKRQVSYWGYNVREIILKDRQYDAMWSAVTYNKVRDPLDAATEARRREWQESCEVSRGLLFSNLPDLAQGATFFHDASYPQRIFVTKDVPGAVFIKQIDDILFYNK